MTVIDPELVDALPATIVANLPDGDLTALQVRAIDEAIAVRAAGTADSAFIERPDGSLLELRIHDHHNHPSDAAILWIHGGGMFLGSARYDDAFCGELSETLGVCVAAVDYRLAPEHPHPEPLEDCYRALVWLAERYDRVVVAGGSAGGGLAAGLALLARDRSGPEIAGLQLYYPMLDDRPLLPSRRESGTPVWDARLDALAWHAYLGGREADQYAAPARAADLRDLPPTYVDTGDLDLFGDDILVFAQRLAAAGVPTDLVVHPGAVHAFELIAPDAAVSRRARARRELALSSLLEAGRSRKETTAP